MKNKSKSGVETFHSIRPALLERKVPVALIGAGGSGSRMLSCLAQLDRAMRFLGHPGGLYVTTFDDDLVSEANIGRQMFAPCDVGLPKSVVLTHRVNMAFGLDWNARVARFAVEKGSLSDLYRGWDNNDIMSQPPKIVVSCVDSAKSRRQIHRAIFDQWQSTPTYWLDLANMADYGQVVLGNPRIMSPAQADSQRAGMPKRTATREELVAKEPPRLPCVTEVFPELLDEGYEEEDVPSCSLAEALEKQSLFVNMGAVAHGADLLWQLFKNGGLSHHGLFFNQRTGQTAPLKVGASFGGK